MDRAHLPALPPCPGCGLSLPTNEPTEHYIDGRERCWHWSCAGKVTGAWPGRPVEVGPEAPEP